MSPRAAVRLEALGFTDVYDYSAGKQDWLANGLPAEGTRSSELRAGDIARSDPPTCEPGASLESLRHRDDIESWGICVVVDGGDVVLGSISRQRIKVPQDDDQVERVMDPGPTTIRPSTSIESIHERLSEADVERVLVTTSRGRLLGVLYREDSARHSTT